jgi:hypothetical protein
MKLVGWNQVLRCASLLTDRNKRHELVHESPGTVIAALYAVSKDQYCNSELGKCHTATGVPSRGTQTRRDSKTGLSLLPPARIWLGFIYSIASSDLELKLKRVRDKYQLNSTWMKGRVTEETL